MRRYARLLHYATPYRAGWAVLVCITILSAALGLLQPWPLKILVDHVLGAAPIPRSLLWLPGASTRAGLLLWVVVAGVGVFAVASVLELLLGFAWIRVGQRMVYDLTGDLFAHVQRLSLHFHERTPVGDSMTRVVSDSWCVYHVAWTLLFAPAQALLMIGGMIAVMAHVDPALTLAAALVAPVMAVATLQLGGPLRRAARLRLDIESRMRSHVQRTLTGIRVVQAFTREDRELRRFRELSDDAMAAQQRQTVVGGASAFASGAVATTGTGFVLWLGAHRVIAGQLSLGSLLVFLAYLAALQAQLELLAGVYTKLQGTGASVDRVLELLEQEPDVRDAPGAPTLPRLRGHVRFENVTFAYGPGATALDCITLDAQPGEVIAIVGASGAGKSTLLSMVSRLIDTSEGRVLLDGHDVRDVQVSSVRAQVAVLAQETFLLPVSIADNIAYGRPDATRVEIEQAARAANAHNFIVHLPQGYDTIAGERGTTLSGGERQRIAIARALLKDAPVLILDEPSSALDSHTEALVLAGLKHLMAGRTTLVAAHRLSTVHHADRIILLERGKVLESGTHDELLARDGAYARAYRLQSRVLEAAPAA